MKNNKDFLATYNDSKKWHCKSAVIFYKTTPDKLVGFVASKKIGNAVKRARAKRRLRGVFLEFQDKIKSGTYIFIAKQDLLDMPYKTFKSHINWSFKRMECFLK